MSEPDPEWGDLEALLEEERELPAQPLARREAVLDRVGERVALWQPVALPNPGLSTLLTRLIVGAALFALGAASGWYANTEYSSSEYASTEYSSVRPSVVTEPHASLGTLEERHVELPPFGELRRDGVDHTNGALHGEDSPEPGANSVSSRPSVRHVPSREPQTASSSSRPTHLEQERRLVDVARAAILRGNALGALHAIERHERTYPRGALSEERDSLRIQALVLNGQHENARLRAAEFLRGYPGSLLRGVVEQALRSIPPTHQKE